MNKGKNLDVPKGKCFAPFFTCDSYSSFCGSTIGQRKCFAVYYFSWQGRGGIDHKIGGEKIKTT